MTQTVTINGTTYAMSDLSSTARDLLRNVEAAEARIKQLKQELDMISIAKTTYGKALMANLPQPVTTPTSVN